MRSKALLASFLLLFASFVPACAWAHDALLIKPLAEKKVTELPPGELSWTIESFDSESAARALEGRWSLVVPADGKFWLFTLGSADAAPGRPVVARVGPIPRIAASLYLLRINDASGKPGSVTPVHSHPGSEAFFVLSGEQSIRGAAGVLRVLAGHSEPGQGAEKAMEVSSSGTADLHALVMFVVDADKPFSSPARLP